MRFGSVCSGIEAASVAFEPLGWQAAWFSEVEPFPSAVLAHHHPGVPNLGDMTKIAQRIASGDVEAPDMLCGGTPCQAFSVAGLRQSLSDERGNLSLVFCELADAIDHSRIQRGDEPCVVFWENVPGVLNTKDNAFGCFLGALAGESDALVPPGGKWANAGAVLGPKRAIAWRVLDAQYFGLAQRRKRVFVVASAREGFDPATVLFEFDGVRRDSAPSREAQEGTAARTLRSTDGGCDVDHARAGHLISEGFDFQNVASTGELCGTLLGEALNANRGCHNPGDFEAGTRLVFDTTQITSPANYSSPKAGDPCHPLAAGAHPPAVAFDCKASGMAGFSVGDIAGTLRAMGHTASHANGGGHLAVAFQTTARPEASPELAYALRADSPSGGGQPQCVAVSGDVAHALNTANNGKGCSEDGTGRGVPTISQGMQVRRLTPEECEALQGFPRGYTAIPWRSRPASECPDGPRYKALGNSWAVPCVCWIGRRIQAHLGGDVRPALRMHPALVPKFHAFLRRIQEGIAA